MTQNNYMRQWQLLTTREPKSDTKSDTCTEPSPEWARIHISSRAIESAAITTYLDRLEGRPEDYP